MPAVTREEATREARVRRLASKKGWRVFKSRSRTWEDSSYGQWFVTDAQTNVLLCGQRGLSLDQVEAWLAEDDES